LLRKSSTAFIWQNDKRTENKNKIILNFVIKLIKINEKKRLERVINLVFENLNGFIN